MKKNFFKKLALVMALAVTVTSVPANSASAAAKPGFESTAVKVKEGQTKKYGTANSEKYSANFKIGNKSVATIAKSGKAVKVTGVTEGKTTLRADFKNYKTKKVTTVRIPVTVVEVVEKEVKLAVTAEQNGAKSFVITSTKDIQAKKLVVKKGSTEVKVEKSEFTQDGKKATVTLDASIVAAEYTVVVGDNEVSATFAGAVSKLASVEFTSDYAIVNGDFGVATSAYTYYVAKNQFGEDVTEKTSLTSTSSPTSTAAKGKITFDFGGKILASQLNNPVTCVVYDNTTGVTAQKTLKITNKALVASIEPYGTNGIYNSNKKTLTVEDKYTESFYYMFRAQDQYGNYLDDVSKMTNANGFYTSFSGGLTNLGLGALTTKVVDGKTYFAYPLVLASNLKAGSATMILVAGGSGKSVNAQITVAEGNMVNKITVTAPSSVAWGDTGLAFNYTALDTAGNEVTSYAQLSKVTVSPAGSETTEGFYWTKVNGKAVLCYNTVNPVSGVGTTSNPTTSIGNVVTATFLTEKFQSSICSFNVKQQRYPAEISGLAAGVATGQASGRDINLKAGSFIVLDQYGEKFDLVDNATQDYGTYAIQYTLVNGTSFAEAYTTDNSIGYGASTPPNTAINANRATKKGTMLTLTAGTAGSETYEFKLVKYTDGAYATFTNTLDATSKDVTALSAKKLTFTSTVASKYVSYKVSAPEFLYVTNDVDGAAGINGVGTPTLYQPSVTVYATDNTGATVKLTEADYIVSGGTLVGKGTSAGKLATTITDTASYNKYFTAANMTVDGTYKVTMNDGTAIENTIKLSNAAPHVTSLTMTNGKNYITTDNALTVDELTKSLTAKDNYGFTLFTDTATGSLYFIGNKYPAARVGVGNEMGAVTQTTGNEDKAGIVLTASDFVNASSSVVANGTANADFSTVVSGDKFTGTFACGTASLSVAIVPSAASYTATVASQLTAVQELFNKANTTDTTLELPSSVSGATVSYAITNAEFEKIKTGGVATAWTAGTRTLTINPAAGAMDILTIQAMITTSNGLVYYQTITLSDGENTDTQSTFAIKNGTSALYSAAVAERTL